MENENEKIMIYPENKEEGIDLFFKLDYLNQEYKNSGNYLTWKNKIESIYGKIGSEVLCSKDGNIIYNLESKRKYKKVKCNICKKFICPYCHLGTELGETQCCCRYCISKLYNEKMCDFFPRNNNSYCNFGGREIDFFAYLIFNSIPLLNLMVFIIFFYQFLYFGLLDKYGDTIAEKRKYPVTNALIFVITMIFLVVSYSIFFFLSYIALIIISIPLKLYPLRIYLSMITAFLDSN